MTGTSLGRDLKAFERVGEECRSTWSLECLLVTRGKLGMSLFVEGRAPLHIPVFGSDEVADVTGAGDTVAAVFATSLAAGGDFEAAAASPTVPEA